MGDPALAPSEDFSGDFASPEDVTLVHNRLQKLVESIRNHGLEFIAIEEAAEYFDQWTDEFNTLDLDPDFDYDDDHPLCWTHPHLDRGILDSLKLAVIEMEATSKLVNLIGTPAEPAGFHKALNICLTKVYEHIRDAILWDFGQDIEQLLGPDVASALPAKPYHYKGMLRKLPSCADKKQSTDTPITECSEESNKKSTDESSNEPSDEASKAEAEVNDESKYPEYHAAAKALKDLSEQDFEDMSKSYYIDPSVGKLLELKYWRNPSRKGKDRSRPYTRWRTKHAFSTVDGVKEFTDCRNLPEPPPPPRPMNPSLVQFYNKIDELGRRHDFRTALVRKANLKDAERPRTLRRSYDKYQAAELLRRCQGGKIDYCFQVHLSALGIQHLSAGPRPTTRPMHARKPRGSAHVPSPLRAVLHAEYPKPADPVVDAEHTSVLDSPRPSERTLPAKASTTADSPKATASTTPNGPKKSSAVPLRRNSQATVDLSTQAGKTNGTSNVAQSSKITSCTESPTIIESSRAGELRQPTGRARLLEMGWKASGLKTVDEVLEFAGLIDPRRPPQKTELAKPSELSELLEPSKISPQKTELAKPSELSKLLEPSMIARFSSTIQKIRNRIKAAILLANFSKSEKGRSWSPPELGTFCAQFLPVKASSRTESSTTSSESSNSVSDPPAEPANLLPSDHVSPTNGPSVKRPRSTSVQQPTDVKRRRKDGDAPECLELQTSSVEDKDVQSEDGERAGYESHSGPVAANQAGKRSASSTRYPTAGYGPTSAPSEPKQARKRRASCPGSPTMVKRRKQVESSAEPQVIIMQEKEGRNKRRNSDPTNKKTLPDDKKLSRSLTL